METNYFVGEIGRTISIYCGFDLTSVVTKLVTILKPDGTTTVTFTGSEVTVDDVTTGQIHISSKSGTFSAAGEYLIQAKMTYATNILYSPMLSFEVEDVL
jgi:hypothetical protein